MALPRHHRPRLAADAATAAAVTAALRAHGAALAPQAAPPTPEIVNSALHVLAEDARYATGAGGAAIALEDGDGMLCRASAGILAPGLGWRLDTKAGFSGECVRSAQLLVCDDASDDPRVDADVCRQLGIRSIVAAPILRAGRVGGIFELFSERPQAFTPQHVERLANLAAEAATVAFGEPMPLSSPVSTPLAGIAQPWPGVRPAQSAEPVPSFASAPPTSTPSPAAQTTSETETAPNAAPSSIPAAPAMPSQPQAAPLEEAVAHASVPASFLRVNETVVPAAASAPPVTPEPLQAKPAAPARDILRQPVTAASQAESVATWVTEDPSLYRLPLSSPRLNKKMAMGVAIAATLICVLVLARYSRKPALTGPMVAVSVSSPETAKTPPGDQASVPGRVPNRTTEAGKSAMPAVRRAHSATPKAATAASDRRDGGTTPVPREPGRTAVALGALPPATLQAAPGALAEVMNVPAAQPEMNVPSSRADLPAVRVSQGATPPVLLRQVRPAYPLAAREMHLQGVVVFEGTVGSDGRVRHLQLISGHPLLVGAARAAVSDWLYRPSQLNGAPHEARTRINVNFVLPQ